MNLTVEFWRGVHEAELVLRIARGRCQYLAGHRGQPLSGIMVRGSRESSRPNFRIAEVDSESYYNLLRNQLCRWPPEA